MKPANMTLKTAAVDFRMIVFRNLMGMLPEVVRVCLKETVRQTVVLSGRIQEMHIAFHSRNWSNRL